MTVLHYRDHQKAVDRWSNMERVRLVEQAMAEPLRYRSEAELVEWRKEVADTAPSELGYDWQGGDCA